MSVRIPAATIRASAPITIPFRSIATSGSSGAPEIRENGSLGIDRCVVAVAARVGTSLVHHRRPEEGSEDPLGDGSGLQDEGGVASHSDP
jgi:hypothetical protein